MWVALIIFLAGIGVLGDAFIKASTAGSILSVKFFIGFTLYALTAFGWFYAMKHVKLASLGGVYGVSTVLLLVFVGSVFFKEQIHPLEWLGIILALVAIILLARFA